MTQPAMDKLRDAIQEWHRADGRDPSAIVTDFAISYAAVDIRTAGAQTYIGTVFDGPTHAVMGLARVLTLDAEDFDEEDQ